MAHYEFDNPIYDSGEMEEEDCELLIEFVRFPRQEEKVTQPHQESLEVVNIGIEDAVATCLKF